MPLKESVELVNSLLKATGGQPTEALTRKAVAYATSWINQYGEVPEGLLEEVLPKLEAAKPVQESLAEPMAEPLAQIPDPVVANIPVEQVQIETAKTEETQKGQG